MQLIHPQEGVVLLRHLDRAVAKPLRYLFHGEAAVLKQAAAARSAQVVPLDMLHRLQSLPGARLVGPPDAFLRLLVEVWRAGRISVPFGRAGAIERW